MTSKLRFSRKAVLALALVTLGAAGACNFDGEGTAQPASGDSAAAAAADSIGVGPITTKITLDAKVDAGMAAKGKTMFEARCTACHKIESKYVGPALAGVTKRRRPEWIMNMILNPGEMTQKDETAKALLAEHLTQMANQNLTPDEARTVLEFFRQNDAGK